ncbi:MAG: xylulokinase [Eubacteriales bacterium]|jgi:sugar (pentulose or hexulose) kinase
MLYLGLDVGTTAVKALICDAAGHIRGTGSAGYPLHSDGVRSEQDARDWYTASARAVRQALTQVDAGEVCAMSLSTQGGTTVPLDASGEPLRYALTWMDARAAEEAAYVREAYGADAFYHTTGWDAAAFGDPCKLRWLQKHEPEVCRAARYWVTTPAYMNLKLTGNCAVDPTNAAMRLLYDFRAGTWDARLLEYAGVTDTQLPTLLPSGAYVGTLTREAADAFGLTGRVRVYNGIHDQYCASLGCGSREAGDVLLSAGTTWVLMAVTERPMYTASRVGVGRHALPGLYGAIASLVGSGASMEWLSQLTGLTPRELDVGAAQRRSEPGLFFYPFLAGESFTHRGEGLLGGIEGLTLRHDRYDLARALMECVAFEVKLGLREFDAKRLVMVGGAARSEVWSGIVADVTGLTVRKGSGDICALGAAMIAAAGEGGYCLRRAAEEMAGEGEVIRPQGSYAEKYDRYRLRLTNLSGTLQLP